MQMVFDHNGRAYDVTEQDGMETFIMDFVKDTNTREVKRVIGTSPPLQAALVHFSQSIDVFRAVPDEVWELLKEPLMYELFNLVGAIAALYAQLQGEETQEDGDTED